MGLAGQIASFDWFNGGKSESKSNCLLETTVWNTNISCLTCLTAGYIAIAKLVA
jgi:hypothetical protein